MIHTGGKLEHRLFGRLRFQIINIEPAVMAGGKIIVAEGENSPMDGLNPVLWDRA